MEKPTSKKVILMDPFPALGHINAFLNLARWLSENGYEVVFIGFSEHQQIYINEGFRFYDLHPLIFIPEAFEIKEKGYFKFFLDNMNKARDKRFLEYLQMITKAYQRIIHVIKPDLVLLDNHNPLKAFFYKELEINVIMVSTMITPFIGIVKPPTQSNYVPTHTHMSRIYIKYLWLMNRTSRKVKNWISILICLGKTDFNIITKIFKNTPYTLDTSRCYGIGIQEIPMIATYPTAFDFGSSNRSVFYFGQLQKVSLGKIDDHRLEALLYNLPEKKIIYCSLGTITFQHQKLCHRFFKRIITVAVKNPQWHFLLNVGKYYNINNLPATPKNISVFAQVPQRQILNRVDLMINHGGINSIKECLSANIPMVVYHLTSKFDQPGCAARVAYHKIGIIGNVRKDNAKTINAHINYLIAHLDEYKENIRHLNHNINKTNRSENKRILSLIKHYVVKGYHQKHPLDDTTKKSVKENPCPTNG